MKFRKKPVVIDAVQYRDGDTHPAICRGGCLDWSHNGPAIHTLEGAITVTDGDWIICGVRGEFYPCKPEIFAATYDPA